METGIALVYPIVGLVKRINGNRKKKKNMIKKIVMTTALILASLAVNAQNDGALGAKETAIVKIAALTANGYTNELRQALNQGLDAGLTVNEAKEILVHLYAYTGFPRSLNGLTTLMDVLRQRRQQGIDDPQGEPFDKELPADGKYERGRETLEKLSGMPQPKPAKGYGEFAPRIDRFLKEHLFADLFDSPVLDHKTRELVTISALASLNGVEAQLNGHLALGKNTGWTDAQLADIVRIASSAKGIDPLHPKSEQKLPADRFTGEAYLTPLLARDTTNNFAMGSVYFERDARTNWHVHPRGQVLIVTAGEGLYQEEGKPAQLIRKGDVVNIPASVKHWHGASAHSPMTHIAVTNYVGDKGVDWLEAVSDEQFDKANSEIKN